MFDAHASPDPKAFLTISCTLNSMHPNQTTKVAQSGRQEVAEKSWYFFKKMSGDEQILTKMRRIHSWGVSVKIMKQTPFMALAILWFMIM